MVAELRSVPLLVPDMTAGRADRLTSLFHQHFDLVWRLTRRLGVSPEAIDDVVQEVFVVVQRKLDAIEVGKERAFLYSTTIRVAADTRRSRTRRHETGEVPETIDPMPSADELVDQKRARMLLDDIVARMPDEARSVFVLYELEGLTMAEIAACLDVPPGTVASRLRRARDGFAAHLARLEAARKGKDV